MCRSAPRAVLGLLFVSICHSSPLTIHTGDYQTATIGDVFAQPLAVSILGVCIDHPCAQVPVTFTVDGLFGSFSAFAILPEITVQNPSDSGIAAVTLYAGSLAGSYLVSATSGADTVYFHETNDDIPGVVPEPGTLGVMLVGVIGVLAFGHRRVGRGRGWPLRFLS